MLMTKHKILNSILENMMDSKKSMIGKVFGFGPMVVLFVGYLIVPLCVIGMVSMTSAFETMSTMTY